MIRLTAVIELEGQAPRALAHESHASTVIIGREDGCDLQIPLSTVSRQHVRISEVDGVYVVEDLGSTHGTMLNGRKLEKGDKKVLRSGDVIELTKVKITCTVEQVGVASPQDGEGTQAIAARAVQGILGRLGEAHNEGPFLRVLCGPDEGQRFSLGGTLSEWTLGRSKDCEFVLNDANVSRRHAVIRKDWNGFYVQDLGSKNGVVINEQVIRKVRRLQDRDEVIVGPIKMVFVDPDAELLSALKDVPGFELESADEDLEPSHMGAPGEEGDPDGQAAEGEGLQDEGPEAIEGEEADQDEEEHEEDDAIVDIDLGLLHPEARSFSWEWIGVAVVGLLIVMCAALLLIILA